MTSKATQTAEAALIGLGQVVTGAITKRTTNRMATTIQRLTEYGAPNHL